MYGPFKMENKHTRRSNYIFDNSLKTQNHLWGIRNIEDVDVEAKKKIFIKRI